MLLVGALLGALAVTCGAFGAHFMPRYLRTHGRDEQLMQKRLGDWEIASRYLMYDALAVVACGLLAQSRPSRSLNIAVGLFLAGALLFSGSLFLLVLLEQKWMGMTLVPTGGFLMIGGWLALAYAGGGYCSAECKVTNAG